MKKQNVLPYIYFGTAIRFLQDVRDGYGIHGEGEVIENIESAIKQLEEMKLQTSFRAVDTLGLRGMLAELKKVPAGFPLTTDHASKLSNIACDLRKVIEAESLGTYVYFVTDKRLTVEKILDHVESLFHPDCFNKLNEVAKNDFREAGRCIAFELPTAAAFHLLRGTESVLRDYYLIKIKRLRIKNLLWGPIVKELQAKKGKDEVLLANLDNIRLNFRNPTQHPEKIYDIQEVQDLFGLCVDVVNRMTES